MRTTSRSKLSQGSSLLGLILLGAGACLVASLVLPFILAQDDYTLALERQRAREIASACHAAQRAGLNPVAQQGVEDTIRNVVKGGKVADRIFFVPGMTEADIPRVAKHLKVTGGRLLYSRTQANQAVQ